MKKIINPIIAHRSRAYPVFIKIELKDGRLSISGVEGSLLGARGQIYTHLKTEDRAGWTYGTGWDSNKMTELLEIWERWHLNDLKAGTPKQEAFVRELRKSGNLSYKAVCDALETAGLLYADGYKYGSKWLREEVPQDVLTWLFSLPNAEDVPAWM